MTTTASILDVCVGRTELLKGVGNILELSAAADYSAPTAGAKVSVYQDGSRAFIFTQGDWTCSRRFFGAGLREYLYIVLEGDTRSCSEIHSVTYRDKTVWQMFCRGTVSRPSALGSVRLCDILMESFIKASSAAPGTNVNRGLTKFSWLKGLSFIRDEIGGLESFSGNERIYCGEISIYTANFIGGFVD